MFLNPSPKLTLISPLFFGPYGDHRCSLLLNCALVGDIVSHPSANCDMSLCRFYFILNTCQIIFLGRQSENWATYDQRSTRMLRICFFAPSQVHNTNICSEWMGWRTISYSTVSIYCKRIIVYCFFSRFASLFLTFS